MIVRCARKLSASAAYLCALCVSLFFASARAEAQAATDPNALRIQLLSGKTGRPITEQHILLLSPDHKFHYEDKTDGEGFFALPPGDLPPPQLEVWVDLHRACSRTNLHTFNPVLIRAKGLVTENTCSKHIHMYPEPGTLVYFVRDETFLEKMRH